jgi:hypothetical protein
MLAFILAAAMACTTALAQQAAPPAELTPPRVYYAPGVGGAVYGGAAFDPRHPQQHQLQAESAQLAQQYAKAEKEDEKKDLRKKLAEALEKQFDLHSQQQQKELDDLEKQIANLRAVWKKRQDAKTVIVNRRLEQLVQEAEGLGWNAPGSPARNLHYPSVAGFGSSSGFSPFAPAPTSTPAPKKP